MNIEQIGQRRERRGTDNLVAYLALVRKLATAGSIPATEAAKLESLSDALGYPNERVRHDIDLVADILKRRAEAPNPSATMSAAATALKAVVDCEAAEAAKLADRREAHIRQMVDLEHKLACARDRDREAKEYLAALEQDEIDNADMLNITIAPPEKETIYLLPKIEDLIAKFDAIDEEIVRYRDKTPIYRADCSRETPEEANARREQCDKELEVSKKARAKAVLSHNKILATLPKGATVYQGATIYHLSEISLHPETSAMRLNVDDHIVGLLPGQSEEQRDDLVARARGARAGCMARGG
jgi:hypothetical protein